MLGLRPAAFVFCAAFLAGCASLYSLDYPAEGVPYFLPKTLVRFQINSKDPTKSQITTIEIADKSRPRYLAYQPNPLSDENLCIARSADGLLEKVYFGAHDRTTDVILDLVELLSRAPPGAYDEPPNVVAHAVPAGCQETEISEWMDPYDEAALRRFNSRLKLCNVSVQIPTATNLSPISGECPSDAVCFVTKSTMASFIQGPDGRVLHSFATQTVVSQRDIGWLKVRGAFFNRRITQLDFENGALKAFKVKRDSEVVGMVRLPIRVIERLLTIPGNAIAAAFGTYQERKLYLEERATLKKAADGITYGEDAGLSLEVGKVSCAAAGST